MNEHQKLTPYERAYEAMMDAKVEAEHAHRALMQANYAVGLALKTGHGLSAAKQHYEEVSARVKLGNEALNSAISACLQLRSQP